MSSEQGGDLFDLPPQVEVYGLQAQAAGLYLGEVKDVVEDGEQSLAREVDCLRVLALLLVEVGVQKEVCHAYDAVHGSADLVAHVGQELALCAVGLLGPLPRRPHLLLGQLALAVDPVEQAGAPPHQGGGGENGCHGKEGPPEFCAVKIRDAVNIAGESQNGEHEHTQGEVLGYPATTAAPPVQKKQRATDQDEVKRRVGRHPVGEAR